MKFELTGVVEELNHMTHLDNPDSLVDAQKDAGEAEAWMSLNGF